MSFMITNVRRCNRNLFITNLLILFVLCGIFYFAGRYYYNFLSGPFEIDKSTLVNIKDPDNRQKYYFKVKGDKVQDSGLSYVEKKRNKYTRETKSTVKSDYLYLTVDDKLLVVKVPHGQSSGVEYKGALIGMAPDVESNLIKMAKEMNITREEFKKIVLPVVLDTEEFGAFAYISLGICLLFLIIVLMNLTKIIKRSNNPYSHPIFKRLVSFGDVNELEKKIDQELEGDKKFTVKNVTITSSWFFAKTFFGLIIIDLATILWTYKKVTQHRTNFIPTGKTYELMINTRNREMYNIKMKERNIEAIIDYLHENHPWIILGFSDEIQALWSKNLQEMISYVDSKRNVDSKSNETDGIY